MSKKRRKSKANKRLKSRQVVSPTETTGTATSTLGVTKLELDRTALTSKEIFAAAPIELCFDTLASQFEQPRQWDVVIVDTQPVSRARNRIGATSRVILNLGGMKRESVAMISRYQPNRALSWALTKKPKVREDWQLEVAPHGTMVSLTLAYEVSGWIIGYLVDKIIRRKKIECDLYKTLTQLKAVVENISRDLGEYREAETKWK